jgi:hypothetical protein
MSNRAKKRVFEPELEDRDEHRYFNSFICSVVGNDNSQSSSAGQMSCSLTAGLIAIKSGLQLASCVVVHIYPVRGDSGQHSENKAQVSLFFELSGGVEADTQAIRVRPEVKIEAGWPHEGWTDRPVARLQAGQMGRNGSRTVTRLAVIPECSTSSRQSSAWPAQLREQGR